MKFTSTAIFVALSLSTTVFSTPLNKKQTSAIDVINGAINTLQGTVTAGLDNIATAAQNVQNSISVTAAVEAAISANVQGIVTAFEDAAAAIAGVATSAVGGIEGLAAGFTQQEVNELVNDIDLATQTIDGIQATFSLVVTDLTPAVEAAIAGEVQTVANAIVGFVAPLQVLASAVEAAHVVANVNVTGLNTAVDNLLNISSSLLGSVI